MDMWLGVENEVNVFYIATPKTIRTRTRTCIRPLPSSYLISHHRCSCACDALLYRIYCIYIYGIVTYLSQVDLFGWTLPLCSAVDGVFSNVACMPLLFMLNYVFHHCLLVLFFCVCVCLHSINFNFWSFFVSSAFILSSFFLSFFSHSIKCRTTNHKILYFIGVERSSEAKKKNRKKNIYRRKTRKNALDAAQTEPIQTHMHRAHTTHHTEKFLCFVFHNLVFCVLFLFFCCFLVVSI